RIYSIGKLGTISTDLPDPNEAAAINKFYRLKGVNNFSCWIRPNYVGLATFLPISILIIADFVITALLTKALFCTNSVRRHSSKTSRRRTMMAKVFLLVSTQFILGAPWVIQYFTINTPYVNGARYAFTVINGLQGFWISSIYFSTYVVFLVQKSRKSKSAPIRTITFVTMTTSSAK
ncbi:unnamed protein product, partial [Soboliphyme baturini]|uniref:G_PROTEIN_RECEP_F1_2 domain-containing protein n=1 Tax=Soboliphyme baturini TaxID=241478 RepID=A0A183IM45_9BILA